ncbi:Glyoxalase/Bleomycin resistance protein/Dihydroxybiphenyl dioxygenase superfamily protein [Klebsormidium nitens]|uniref:Glyoxalase/Bleomycin resistance protein/Dihydroxybiphenyl dioxygenase superfamily protein n=1 Tax=Klebsormidium nitens TaxID=105231 RepID=A0A1Y1IHU9_KLENI|nr:Glyoxalase/Bleomycin resistance protein/Dihydroxybiphenyl dioxygenase superfamily protein [Klebsormidium nitens]|eukprot:GAQ89079.1 Glyoxalase/Bleomycin resistance protein/Dihydroxybiphenyl dioxygenase superfamily protein [Klebsormidium nitens]
MASTDVEKRPKAYHTLTPYLTFKGASQAMEFYKSAFGATEIYSLKGPGGIIAHAEMSIGDSLWGAPRLAS